VRWFHFRDTCGHENNAVVESGVTA
jgi:hypothetical protein